MATQEHKGLGKRLMGLFNRLVDFGLDVGPSVYQDSIWKEPALEYNDIPTAEIAESIDPDKIIHLHEYYKIADALSWEIGMYFISKRDTATFLMPFSSDLALKARDSEIESWCHKGFTENRRDIYYIRVGDLLAHIAENPLPGDDWEVKTLGKGAIFSGELRHRPLQIRKLMIVSAAIATDQRPAIDAAPDDYYSNDAAPAAASAPRHPHGPAPLNT